MLSILRLDEAMVYFSACWWFGLVGVLSWEEGAAATEATSDTYVSMAGLTEVHALSSTSPPPPHLRYLLARCSHQDPRLSEVLSLQFLS